MTTDTPNPTPAESEIPALTLTDLASIRNIIEAATSRGAFKANELKEVGTVYDKLDQFLKAVAIPQQPADSQPKGE
jgi:hypothetical protein